MQEEVEACLKDWKELLEKRNQTEFTSMAQLHSYYDDEHATEYDLEKAEERLHSFQIGPFLDLSDISQKRREEASKRAKDLELPLTEQMQALHEERDNHEQYLEACESLHELSIDYKYTQAERIEGILLRMKEDRDCIGKAWDTKARARMDRIENKLNSTFVDMLRTKCRSLANQKDRLVFGACEC